MDVFNEEIENVLIKTEHLDEEECNAVEEEPKAGSEEDARTSNEKPYKCGICGHRATTDTLLKVHMKMHLVKRLHQCNICKRTFSFVTELNSHILTHTKDKSNFQCELCHRDCFTEEDLQRHYRIHTKEKPFKCKLCSRSFSDDSYLRVHERSHHGEDYLRKIMKKDGTYVDPSLVQNLNEDGTSRVSVSVQKTAPSKKFNNNPIPLNNEERLLLYKKYPQLELLLKSHLRNNWAKMVEFFTKHGYNRNPEKLTWIYFQLKNQAKTHVQRYYKDKKLPMPREMDYIFVKMYPSEFTSPGIDIARVLEDSKRYTRNSNEVVIECVLSCYDEDEEEIDPLLRKGLSGSSEHLTSANMEAASGSHKRTLSESEGGAPSKKLKRDDEDTLSEINRLKLRSLLAEEHRKYHLYEIELKERKELFDMEKRHRKEIYEKELEIKNLALMLLRKKSL